MGMRATVRPSAGLRIEVTLIGFLFESNCMDRGIFQPLEMLKTPDQRVGDTSWALSIAP